MYFPFGWGSQICLGMNVSMIQGKLVLAKILQNYSFELSPSYAHGPTMPALVLQPQYGAPMIVPFGQPSVANPTLMETTTQIMRIMRVISCKASQKT
uniref:Cytochrome P450 n=1 Tax=Solanum lycopersicum TaxID=4081 RepID=A0A3Q7HX68_SOLLC